MNKAFQSLLPPGACPQEKALEQANAELITAINSNRVRDVKNPDLCPLHLLPWLAWEFAVDFWDENWTEAEKRQVIKDAAYVHQHRGTAGAVRRSLSSVSLPTNVVEWWQDTPRQAPYSFRVEVYSEQAIDQSLYRSIRRQVEKSKNLRSQLSTIDVIANIGTAGMYYCGGAVTAHIDIDIQTGTDR